MSALPGTAVEAGEMTATERSSQRRERSRSRRPAPITWMPPMVATGGKSPVKHQKPEATNRERLKTSGPWYSFMQNTGWGDLETG